MIVIPNGAKTLPLPKTLLDSMYEWRIDEDFYGNDHRRLLVRTVITSVYWLWNACYNVMSVSQDDDFLGFEFQQGPGAAVRITYADCPVIALSLIHI